MGGWAAEQLRAQWLESMGATSDGQGAVDVGAESVAGMKARWQEVACARSRGGQTDVGARPVEELREAWARLRTEAKLPGVTAS